jgi:hypothetical protein
MASHNRQGIREESDYNKYRTMRRHELDTHPGVFLTIYFHTNRSSPFITVYHLGSRYPRQ